MEEKNKQNPEDIYLFVYGTLMSGLSNNHYLEGDTFVSTAQVEQCSLIDLGYFPGMVDTDRYSRVEGELWKVSQATLKTLDILEGVPHLFHRDAVTAVIEGPGENDLESISAYAYFYNEPWSYVPHGDWRYLMKKREEGEKK